MNVDAQAAGMELRSHPHCVFNIKAHLILITAHRRPVLTDGLLAELDRHVRRIGAQAEVDVLEFNGEAVHVHLLRELHPNIQSSKIVNSIKTVSSRKIRRHHWREVRKILRGGRFWSRSYCWISVGNGATTEIIKRYIQGQDSRRAIHPRPIQQVGRGLPRRAVKFFA